MVVWMNKNELLVVIDYEDFYRAFKEFLEKVEKIDLDDEINKNKI